MNLIIPTIKAIILFLWHCITTTATTAAAAHVSRLLISLSISSEICRRRFGPFVMLACVMFCMRHSYRIFRMFMYNLFNNVQSILNKMVLFAAIIIIIGTLWWWRRRRWHDLQHSHSHSKSCCKIFAVLCKSFTMINGIVFHTYDSLL